MATGRSSRSSSAARRGQLRKSLCYDTIARCRQAVGTDGEPFVTPEVGDTDADPGGSRPLVMLVEDDPVASLMYRIGLEAAGFVVEVLGDGSELFKALATHVPDVVVLDWELPGLLTGVDILENLHLDDRTGQLPVIMLSNHLGDIDGAEDRASKAGAPWLLKVRTTPAQLAERLHLILRRTV